MITLVKTINLQDRLSGRIFASTNWIIKYPLKLNILVKGRVLVITVNTPWPFNPYAANKDSVIFASED